MRKRDIFIAIAALIAATLAFAGCDLSSGSSKSPGGVTINPASAPRIPGSLGGGSETSGAAQMSSLGSVGALSGDDTPEYVAEYGNFTIVAEIALNYNGNMEFLAPYIQQLALDYQAGIGTWVTAEAPFDVMISITDFDGPAGEVPHEILFRANTDFSHWELMVDNTGTSAGDRIHFEVRRYSSFTHGRAFFYQTPNETGTKDVDSVDIIETPSHIFTKGVRIFDMEAASDIYTFAGITINDSAQRTLGVINIGNNVTGAAGLDPAFIPDSWTENELVGAFDSTQQMIRPDLDGDGNLPAPLKYANAGGYTTGTDDAGDPWPQGETFDATLFPSLAQVRPLLDLGINPTVVGESSIDTDLSYSYSWPAWDPPNMD